MLVLPCVNIQVHLFVTPPVNAVPRPHVFITVLAWELCTLHLRSVVCAAATEQINSNLRFLTKTSPQ